MRNGEMAALGEVPFGLYYGSVDSTPLFVLLAGLYFERTGDRRDVAGAVAEPRGGARTGSTPTAISMATALSNITRKADRGLANQGWKDSYDAVFHADGRLAEGPIALVEVQGYVYAAKLLAARCARRLGDMERGARSGSAGRRACASSSTPRSGATSIGTYAIALDGDKQPVPGAHIQRRPGAVFRHRVARTGGEGRERSDGAALLFGLGHSHAGARRSRATTRCPITTARSGRTTTR